MEQDKHDEKLLWELAFHEDNLYNNRLQVFLAAHTLLVAAISLSFGKNDLPQIFVGADPDN